MKAILSWLFIGISVPAAHAQRITSLSDAWKLAEKNYPGIAVKASVVKRVEYQQKITYSNLLPQIDFQFQNNYGTYYGSSGAFFPLPGLFNINGSTGALNGINAISNAFGSVTAAWTLYNFGSLNAAGKAASFLSKSAHGELDAYKLNLKTEVASHYLALSYKMAKEGWAAKNEDRVKKIFDISVSLSKAGLEPGADTALAASSYLQLSADHDNWVGQQRAAMELLRSLIGDTATYIPIMTNYLNGDPYVYAMNDSVWSAHPYLNVIQQKINYNKENGIAVSRSAYPRFMLLGGLSQRTSGIDASNSASGKWQDGFNNPVANYIVGIGLTWSITGIYKKSLQKQVIDQQLQAEQYNYKTEQLTLATNVKAATEQLLQLESEVRKNKASVVNARNAYRQYIVRYQSGLMDLTNLLQIQLLLQKAEDAQIETSHRYWQQQLKLAEATGDFSYLFKSFNY